MMTQLLPDALPVLCAQGHSGGCHSLPAPPSLPHHHWPGAEKGMGSWTGAASTSYAVLQPHGSDGMSMWEKPPTRRAGHCNHMHSRA